MSELEPLKELSEKKLLVADDARMASLPTLAFRAMLWDERAYRAVYNDAFPLKRGSLTLLFALGITAVARLAGVFLGTLTMPKVGVLQEQLLNAVTSTEYFGRLTAQSPDFASAFSTAYAGVWQLVRVLGGYPSFAGLAGSLVSLLFFLGSWLVYATAVHLVAHWFGSDVDYKRSLGVMALAYTPILLTVVEAVPGASVPYLLIFTLILIAKFLAIKTLYDMSPGQNLAILALPYLGGLLLLMSLLLFAAAFGLNQLPIVDDILRTLRFGQALR